MKRIAIIGAGQLGSRHLQALAVSKHLLDIQVMDTSEESLKIAESRFNEVAKDFKGKISFVKSIDLLEKEIELAIVATNSKVRRMVIEQLTSHSNIKNFILEKFLFPNESDFDVIEKLIQEAKISTWVNCPRRMMPLYKMLKQEVKGPIHFSVTGNAWGLGCNGIHLLDLFSYLIDSTAIEIDNELIDSEIIESKRAGYIEFTGTIKGVAGKNTMSITSFSNASSPVSISIQTPTARYSIQEGAETKVWISKLENNWAWEEQSHKMLFQSQLTNIAVDSIIDNGTCDLTTYSESSLLHKLFLNNLIQFLQLQKNDQSIKECLIT